MQGGIPEARESLRYGGTTGVLSVWLIPMFFFMHKPIPALTPCDFMKALLAQVHVCLLQGAGYDPLLSLSKCQVSGGSCGHPSPCGLS